MLVEEISFKNFIVLSILRSTLQPNKNKQAESERDKEVVPLVLERAARQFQRFLKRRQSGGASELMGNKVNVKILKLKLKPNSGD